MKLSIKKLSELDELNKSHTSLFNQNENKTNEYWTVLIIS